MAAPSPVLYALHNTIEPRAFEQLCVDLLIRDGHSRIVPGGGIRDHGRDAEVRYWIGPHRSTPQTVFQFSMEVRWEAKLRQDISKILRSCETVERIIFVSNRSITVEKQDKLRAELWESNRIALEILDEGWFRVRLEEEHIDLALKHLGVVVEPTPGFFMTQVKIHGLTDENREEMLRHTTPEALRATFTAQTQADPKNSGSWKGLAHVCYYLRNYEDALFAVSKALRFSDDELERWNMTALKASIIAEQGIQSGSRLLLKKARKLFKLYIDRLGRSIDHYNFGNVLGALDERTDAEVHYRRCLELDPNYAQAWKNLGSLLVQMGRKKEGMKCLDKALQLNPDLVEALCTKANVIVMSSKDCAEALSLMERAFEIDPDLERRWPHAHYWYAVALCREDRLPEAFTIVEDRLERKADCPYLGRLTNDILSKLWRTDPAYLNKAEDHFALRIDAKEPDHRALHEMLDILYSTNRESYAWQVLDDFLELEEISSRRIAKRIPLTIPDLSESLASVEYYRRFRRSSPLVDYAKIMDDLKLEPHNDVPNLLFYLLAVSYGKIATVFQDAKPEANPESGTDAIRDTYKLISRIFASFGGFLLSPTAPKETKAQTALIAGGVLAGQDIPLMEISRLLGYLSGVSGRPIPEHFQKVIVDTTPFVHEGWLKEFLTAVGHDWKIDALRVAKEK